MPKKSPQSRKATPVKKSHKEVRKTASIRKKPLKKSVSEKRSNVVGVILILLALVLTIGAVINSSVKRTTSAQAGSDGAIIIAPATTCTVDMYQEKEGDYKLLPCNIQGSTSIEIQSEAMCGVTCHSGKEMCELVYDKSLDVIEDTNGEGLVEGVSYVGCEE